MASKDIWKQLKHFNKVGRDNWGNADEMDHNLLLILDDFRRFIGKPVHILQGNGGRHSKDSYHYIENGSCAVDVAIPDWELSSFDLLLAVFRFPFTGVGYYPHWEYGGEVANGLHLDTRPLKWDNDFTMNYTHNRWMGIKVPYEKDDTTVGYKQEYIPMTFHNIIKHTQGEVTNGIS